MPSVIRNPISPTASDIVTVKQSTAYNILLTQMAKTVDELQKRLADNTRIDKQSHAVLGWQYLLWDIENNLIPEFYVVFQDKTINASQRRQLYDMTQAIYYALNRYNTPIFVKKLALCQRPVSDKVSLREGYQMLMGRFPQMHTAAATKHVDSNNNYLTGEGVNASTAYALTTMAKHVAISGHDYIRALTPYYNLLLKEEHLLQGFENKTANMFVDTLIDNQRHRLQAFDAYTGDPDHFHQFDSIDHPLVTWVNPTSHDRQLSTVQQDLGIVKYLPIDNTIVVKPEQFKKGLMISGGSVILGSALFSGVGMLALPMGIIYGLSTLYGPYQIADAVTDNDNPRFRANSSALLAFAAIFLLVSGLSTAIAIPLLATAFWIKLLAGTSNHNSDAQLPFEQHQNEVTVTQDFKNEDDKEDDFASIQKTAIDTQAEVVKTIDETHYDLPLDITRHGYHLAILLSKQPTATLEQLIVSTNKLYDHLDYLQEAHPYLATRVNELIKDLTQNTLIRLDELARQFVKEGHVDEETRAVFIELHEARINDLLTLNLEQVNELNKTILEKKMSGFLTVGQDAELQFRNGIMELKILLRWLIAQQPDEIQASSHEVILQNLETTTLVDMQDAFFNSQTTAKQREDLQSQLDSLINHFKQQTTSSLYRHNTEQDEADIQDLLRLSRSKDSFNTSKTSHSPSQPTGTEQDLDVASGQAHTQDFIELNRHYINEILSHWH